MDTKEKLEILQKLFMLTNAGRCPELDIAISALEKVETLEAENARLREKETPKEPLMRKGNSRDLFCSICGARVSDVADKIINSDNLQKYCGVCGQLLDWSSDKE